MYKQYYIGYKLHLTIGMNGVYQGMELTKASVHDVHYLKEIKYSGLRSCVLLGDKGYLSTEWQLDLFTSVNIELQTECSNALQVIPFLHEHPVDILFLDIRMPQLNGLELVSTLTNPPKIIFTTAYGEYALESYDLQATDYLLKPIKFERFVKAVNRAIPNSTPAITQIPIAAQANDSFLYFRADRKMVRVILKDILYIESLKDYVRIITPDGQVITKTSMAAIEAMLPAARFLRIHRSFIAATDKITAYDNTHVQISALELPIGKMYQHEVFKRLQPLFLRS